MRKVFGKEIDTISKRGDIFTVRKAFLADFTNDIHASLLEFIIQRHFPTAKIIERGRVIKSYRQKARLSKTNHWFVKFTLNEEM